MLRRKVMTGGVYLVGRQAVGLVFGLVGTLLVTRTIGPTSYGTFAAAFGVQTFLYNLCQCGVAVYLVRKEMELTKADCDAAATFLLLVGVLAALGAIVVSKFFARWVGISGLSAVATVLFVGLPLQLVALVYTARWERSLDYRRVALAELMSQIGWYCAAIPLALNGAGAWSLVAGWWAGQVTLFVLLSAGSGYRPRLEWNIPVLRRMLGYGLAYSASMWIYQIRSLVNPLVVGRFLGAGAVGYVALSARVVELLGFARGVVWRVSIAALSRIQSEPGRVVRAMTDGMRLQVAALGPSLLGFSVFGPLIVPWLLGSKWLAIVDLYPFLAAGYLVSAMFALHSSALYVLRRNWDVARFHVIHIVLFATAAFVLIPRLGLVGYGWAEISTIAAYPVIHYFTTVAVGRPHYALSGAWVLGFGIALFWRELGFGAFVPLAVILLLPSSWKTLLGYFHELRQARERSTDVA